MSTTYLQPSIERFGNFRASEQAAITVGLTNTLDLKLALDISHDSEPPAGVERTDTKFTTGLAYRF
jgi:putative salt-induced outer membrane protein YdiY